MSQCNTYRWFWSAHCARLLFTIQHKKMFKLAQPQHGNKHVWLLYVEGSSLLFHGQFLLISHTAMNLSSQPQKQTGSAATVHIQIQQTMKCNGKQSLLLEMAWLLCTLHSLRIQMSAVVLCLMCQIWVLILSAVYSPHASVYKLQKLWGVIEVNTTVLIACISHTVWQISDFMYVSLSLLLFELM